MRMGPGSAAGSAPKAGAAPPANISELYSPPRVTAMLPKSGLVAGSTFDLKADKFGVTSAGGGGRASAKKPTRFMLSLLPI